METTFKPYLAGIDLKRVKEWDNGYNFLKDKLYNPFDILLLASSTTPYASIQPNLIKILIQKQNKYKEGFSKF
jgi:hypothetical protein